MFTIMPVPMATGKNHTDKITNLTRDSDNTKREVDDLQGQLARLHLITQALWELVQSQTDLKDEDLLKMIHEIDQRDGKLDGKYNPTPEKCVQCGRVVSIRTNVCIYCGIKAEKTSAF